ncbi:hypothetical protein [Butyrivibrio sp. INlla16]|uniref:hypothetical protein n=1 Tax=Butyrivibrio sp. INlla16 TaxID=1520807 RepID=UPI000884C977|nr:hypothetical protein [Butyrivibrio sp. INlla16]SDB66049.1 hypothetical protein SAMN02910263_03790 [Butyrivibrio sp. INlla16]
MGRLLKVECETIVNFNRADPFAIVYTRDKDVMDKLDALCKKYPDRYALTKQTGRDKYYRMPKEYVKFYSPAQNSESARRAASERMKKMNCERYAKMK